MIDFYMNFSYYLDGDKVILHDEHGREVAEICGYSIAEKIRTAEKFTALCKLNTALEEIKDAIGNINFAEEMMEESISNINRAINKSIGN